MMRIALVDDHAVMRAGLKSLLETQPDMVVVGEAGDGIECLEMIERCRPDTVVLDINMPRCNGIEALTKIRDLFPDTKVLALTMHDDLAYLRRVISSGGAGFVLKQFAAEELLGAIRAVGEGGLYLHPRHAKVLLEDQLDAVRPAEDNLEARYRSLSEREIEIFELTALGHRNTEIAEKLFLSVKTVETYRARMMRKLAIGSRSELVRAAIDLGILT